MYFSMHAVTQVVSLLEMPVPGLGTHFSKQFSLTFCFECQKRFCSIDGKMVEGHASNNCRELFVLDSTSTCRMMAFLTDSESMRFVRKDCVGE